MGAKTGIEWTDATWNPIRGCSRVSEGCRYCYAENRAYRFGGPGQPYEGLLTIGADGERKRQWNGNVRFVEKHLLDPLKWKTPRRIFVNSMSDLFHPNVKDEWIDLIFAVMALCPQHTFQVLTKRPWRMLEWAVAAFTEEGGLRIGRAAASLFKGMSLRDKTLSMAEQAAVSNKFEWKELQNVWLGVSCEDQATADARIPLLLQTPAAVRFISAEPLLGEIKLDGSWIYPDCHECGLPISRGWHDCPHYNCDATRPWKGSALVDWVICGGESGHRAHPMHPDWARGLRDKCQAAGVPFFFKQWGEWSIDGKPYTVRYPESSGKLTAATTVCSSEPKAVGRISYYAYPAGIAEKDCGPVERLSRMGKKATGALLDGFEWKQFPEVAR